jgi:hypothetical protein
MYTDTTTNFLSPMYTLTAIMSAESTISYITANTFDAQIHNLTKVQNGCLHCAINFVHFGFVPGITT